MNLYSKPTSCVLVGLFVLFIGVLCPPVEAYKEGPWLWMIASGADIDSDQLAVASKGKVTENLAAKYGVNEGIPWGSCDGRAAGFSQRLIVYSGSGAAIPIMSTVLSTE